MNLKEQLKILCIKNNISMSELARLLNTSPQAFNQKINRNTLTPNDLENIAKVLDIEYKSYFIAKDGTII